MKKILILGFVVAASPIVIGVFLGLLGLLGLYKPDGFSGLALLAPMGLLSIVGMVLVLIAIVMALIDLMIHRGESNIAKIAQTPHPLSTMEKAVGIAVVLIVLSLCFTYFRIT